MRESKERQRPHSRRALAVLCAVALAAATACASPGDSIAGKKTAVGGLGGAVAGGLLGKSIGGHSRDVIAGAVLGGLLGGAVGNVLDQRDRDLAIKNAQVAFETAPTGTASSWTNPDTGNHGSITPVRTYQEPTGRYCREYQQDVVVGGERQQSYGTACRQPDGSWQVQN